VLEPRRPTPAVIAERLLADRPTLFFGVPTFFAALLASDLPDDAFSSVRLATSAGEPLPAALQARFTARFGVEIIDGLGSTEARLLEHPAVAQVAVIGVPDENGLDKPVAVVVAAEPVTEDALVGWCRQGLAAFKRPRRVLFVDELPKTATGKIQRFKVRDLVA